MDGCTLSHLNAVIITSFLTKAKILMGLGPNLDLQICILQVSNFANQINLTLSNLISFYNLALPESALGPSEIHSKGFTTINVEYFKCS